jgi:hypothetical protein
VGPDVANAPHGVDRIDAFVGYAFGGRATVELLPKLTNLVDESVFRDAAEIADHALQTPPRERGAGFGA